MLTFVKCPSCDRYTALSAPEGACSHCGAHLEAASASPVVRRQTEPVIEQGRLKGTWLLVVLAVAVAVVIGAAVLFLHLSFRG